MEFNFDIMRKRKNSIDVFDKNENQHYVRNIEKKEEIEIKNEE